MPLIFAFFGAYAFHPIPLSILMTGFLLCLGIIFYNRFKCERDLDRDLNFHEKRLLNVKSERARLRGVPVEWVKDKDLEKCLAAIADSRVSRKPRTFYTTTWDPVKEWDDRD